MTWFFAIFLSVFLYAISVLLQRTVLKAENTDPTAFSIFTQVFIAVLIAIYALFTTGLYFTFTNSMIFPLILLVFLYGFGSLAIQHALKLSDAATFTLLFASRGIFTVIASTLLLHEGLNPKQIFGVVFIFISIVLVTLKTRSISIRKADLIALLAALLLGFANTNDRYLLGVMQLYPFLILAYLLPALFSAVIFPKSAMKMFTMFSFTTFVKSCIFCVLYAISGVTFFIALQTAPNSSQVAIINLSSVILIVVFSMIFLKERENVGRKLLAVAISFAGLVLLTL